MTTATVIGSATDSPVKSPSLIDAMRNRVGQTVVGQDQVVERVLIALLTGGHLLLQGMPGLAKTLLVNNAGIAPSKRADILEASEESFDQLMNVNLKGPYFLTQLVARRMIDQKTAGKIINITSVSAYTASTNRGDYCISKAGLSMMTKLYAARLAQHGINVYEIRPGIIETDMTGPVKQKYDKLIFENDLTPIARWGTPLDVARAVVACASGSLPFSTGQVIDVDGGFHLRRL
jgi:NAD(P)-dependent dehydrogenase (short-subunit alcohol dehydrogenase family)